MQTMNIENDLADQDYALFIKLNIIAEISFFLQSVLSYCPAVSEFDFIFDVTNLDCLV